MKKLITALVLLAGIAEAQFFGFTPQQIQFLDLRYWRTTNAFDAGLNTGTVFGGSGNVTGFWYNLTYNETDPIFGPWLTSFSATNVPGATYSADTTTTTNNGSGQFSVKGYNYVYYQVTNNADWIDFEAGNFRQATWGEMESGPSAVDWGELE